MTISLGVELEKQNALTDAKDIIDLYGADIITYERRGNLDSLDVSRDVYGSIKRHLTTDSNFMHTMKAYPIINSPNNKQIEKAGLREISDIIIYTAMKDWINLGIIFEKIDLIRDTIIINNVKYGIKEKNQVNHFADTFLNIVFGLSKL